MTHGPTNIKLKKDAVPCDFIIFFLIFCNTITSANHSRMPVTSKPLFLQEKTCVLKTVTSSDQVLHHLLFLS